MAWERRGRGRYYYRERKVEGRVVKEYVGNGEVARVAAELDAQARAQRAAEAAAIRTQEARLEPAERATRELHAGCKLLMEAVLATAGCFQHARGEWRRRRARLEPDRA